MKNTLPNFKTGNPLLLQSFRSVNCLVRNDNNCLIPNSVNVAKWIESYFNWFNDQTKVEEGENLHLVYFRNVNIIGDEIMPCFGQILPIAQSCKNTGIGFSITIKDSEALDYSNIIHAIVNEKLLHTVGLRITSTDFLNLNNLISYFIDNSISVALIGDIKFILNQKILSNSTLNGSNFSIYPTKEDFLNKGQNSSLKKKACSNIFRLFIDELGNIYPCLGLIGIEYLSMGNVNESFSNSIFAAGSRYLNLELLNSSGYNYTTIKNDDVDTYYELPTMCQAHRIDVLNSLHMTH